MIIYLLSLTMRLRVNVIEKILKKLLNVVNAA
jgi:hypothetical protein